MVARLVHCVKYGRQLPGLPRPPFPGDLGQKIFDGVSQAAWQLWQQQQTILINHYGLNMADPRATAFLMEQMEEFFFGAGAQLPDEWIPEGEGGKGAPAAKDAPAAKGAPAPRAK